MFENIRWFAKRFKTNKKLIKIEKHLVKCIKSVGKKLILKRSSGLSEKTKSIKNFVTVTCSGFLEQETKKAFKLQKLTSGAVVKILYYANS